MHAQPNRRTTAKPSREPARELIVLGLLRRAPMSAYAVDRTMRDHAPLYRPFKLGNTYHFIDALAADGLLKARNTAAKRGPRATKPVFRLSASGEMRFRKLLGDTLGDVQTTDAALETALVLLGQLSRGEASALLKRRLQAIADHEARLHRLWGDIRGKQGAASLASSHHVHRLRAERRFAEDAIGRLRDPGWSADWQDDDGAITEASRTL